MDEYIFYMSKGLIGCREEEVYVGRGKKMREKLESAVQRTLEIFEEEFQWGSVIFWIRNHASDLEGGG